MRAWRQTEGRWSAGFVSPAADVPRAGWEGRIDIELHAGDDGSLTGLLNFAPRPG